LAGSLGLVAHGYISELEAGKKQPTVEILVNVAKRFKVTTDALLNDEVELSD